MKKINTKFVVFFFVAILLAGAVFPAIKKVYACDPNGDGSDCGSGQYCDFNGDCQGGTSTQPPSNGIGSQCFDNGGCASGACDLNQGSRTFETCISSQNVSTGLGSSCSDNSGCASGACDLNPGSSTYGTCLASSNTSNGLGSQCSANAGCNSGKCDLNSGTCVANNGAGSQCFDNSGCASNNCNLTTNQCAGGAPSTLPSNTSGLTKNSNGTYTNTQTGATYSQNANGSYSLVSQGSTSSGGGSTTITCPSGSAMQNGVCVLASPSSGGIAGQTTLSGLLTTVLKIMLALAGIVAVVFIIIGGYMYMTAGGNEETAEKGRKALVNAVIGLVIIILSYVIVQVITTALTTGSVFGG